MNKQDEILKWLVLTNLKMDIIGALVMGGENYNDRVGSLRAKLPDESHVLTDGYFDAFVAGMYPDPEEGSQ